MGAEEFKSSGKRKRKERKALHRETSFKGCEVKRIKGEKELSALPRF